MDIGNIQGPGGINRHSDRPDRVDARKPDAATPARPADSAAISDTGRETLQSVEALAERAKGGGEDRSEIVAQAAARLQSGELDTAAVLKGTAQRLFEAGF